MQLLTFINACRLQIMKVFIFTASGSCIDYMSVVMTREGLLCLRD